MSITPIRMVDGALLATGAAPLFTGDGNSKTIIKRVALTNSDVGARTVDVWLLPSTATGVADAYRLCNALSINAGETKILYAAHEQVIHNAGTLVAQSDAADKVNAVVSGLKFA